VQRAGDARAFQRLRTAPYSSRQAIRPGISVSAMVEFLAAEFGEMTFDIDLDRSVTRAEFAAGFKRLAGQINPSGELTFVDLVQPLNRSGEQASASPPPRPPGR
jgi:hypothetical protein